MNLRWRLQFRLLPVLLVLMSGQRNSCATGIEEPTRWLGLGSKIVLDPPEFFFELETKRIAQDLHPEFRANIPPGIDSDRNYGKQTDEADVADFEDAIKSGALHPADVEKARAAHKSIIKALGRNSSAQKKDDDETVSNNSSDLPTSTSTPSSPTPSPTPTPTKNVSPAMTTEFASEFADYHRGALKYHTGDKGSAQGEWQALLNRPAAGRKYRTTWAEYMLGKMALEAERPDEARAHFQKLREEAKGGAIDSLGLAAASIGWEAQIELKAHHFSEAARLYLEQRVTGDPTAVNSLHALLDELIKAQPDLTTWMSDPLLQRLATGAALSGIGAFGESPADAEHPNGANQWLQILEKADAKQVKDAECVAWMQYQKGEYAATERWLKLADAESPYALWLKAKLALRAGKVDVAAQLLSRALPKLPMEMRLESRTMEFETMPGDVSKGDLGLLHVGRADFVNAGKLFLTVRNCDDAVYLAEGVFTLDELKKFVDQLPEKTKKEDEFDSSEDNRKTFREIIGRRLMRAGKFAEARPYFTAETQKAIDEYVDLTKKANDARASKSDRADAFWKAAQLINDHEGHNLFDYALPAAMLGRLAGHNVKEEEVPFSAGKISYAEPIKFVPPVTEAEKKRLKSNITSVHRYHADYIAADLAWRAAQLMPDDDARTATVLNTAGSWLKNGDEKAADRFYQAIERRCPKTEIGREAVKRHWFVPSREESSDKN